MEFMIVELPIELLRALTGGGGPPRELAPEEQEKFRAYAKAVMFELTKEGIGKEAMAMARSGPPFIYQVLLNAILDETFQRYERDISVEDCVADIRRNMQQQKDEVMQRRDEELLKSLPDDGITH